MTEDVSHFVLTDRDYSTACGITYDEPPLPRGSNRPELTTCPACITARTDCKGAQS